MEHNGPLRRKDSQGRKTLGGMTRGREEEAKRSKKGQKGEKKTGSKGEEGEERGEQRFGGRKELRL